MRPLTRPAAFVAAFVLVLSLFSLGTVSATAAEGACATVKSATATKLQKRTKAVKKARTKFAAAKRKLRAAQRSG